MSLRALSSRRALGLPRPERNPNAAAAVERWRRRSVNARPRRMRLIMDAAVGSQHLNANDAINIDGGAAAKGMERVHPRE
ncbi:unnamed protein product [Lampetra fluviatilis]